MPKKIWPSSLLLTPLKSMPQPPINTSRIYDPESVSYRLFRNHKAAICDQSLPNRSISNITSTSSLLLFNSDNNSSQVRNVLPSFKASTGQYSFQRRKLSSSSCSNRRHESIPTWLYPILKYCSINSSRKLKAKRAAIFAPSTQTTQALALQQLVM